MRYIASVSFGKDSLAMLLLLLEKDYPLDEVIFYDTGMEFKAIYDIRDKVIPMLKERNVQYTELHADKPFEYYMYEHPVRKKGSGAVHKYGYSWCGGTCRWGTSQKTTAIDKYFKNMSYGEVAQYVGIAYDEPERLARGGKNKLHPLADWGMAEADCLEYCYSRGFEWMEDGIRLYDVLQRVSCWCCRNKNLKELENMYLYLPTYWKKLKEMQSKLKEPMKGDKSVFDLEKRFYYNKLQRKLKFM